MVKRVRGGKSAARKHARKSCRKQDAEFAVAEAKDRLQSTAIERVGITDLRPNPRNPRQHTDRQVSQLAAGISNFGFLVPIVVDGHNTILAGHGRFLAAQKLGLTDVPVVRAGHLSAAQKRAFCLADNRLAERSSWDPELLKLELEELSALDLGFEVELTGFDTVDIDRLIAPAKEQKVDPDDALPAINTVAISKLGDVWQLGAHRLICGDARARETYSRLLNGQMAEMVFTDPPYNVKINGHATQRRRKNAYREFPVASGELRDDEYRVFLQQFCRQTADATKNGGINFLCIDWRHARDLLTATEPVYGEPKNLCVWVKENAGMGSFYRSGHELIFVFKVGNAAHINNFGLGENGRYRTNVWRYPSPNMGAAANHDVAHPTVKPCALVMDAIKDCSRRGGLILDPFVGSGTTIIAADRCGRRAAAAELDPLYVDLTIRRWQDLTGGKAIHAETKSAFSDLGPSQG